MTLKTHNILQRLQGAADEARPVSCGEIKHEHVGPLLAAGHIEQYPHGGRLCVRLTDVGRRELEKLNALGAA